MPVVACFGNLAWETYYLFFEPWNPTFLVVNCFWFALDLIILYQVFKYAPREFSGITVEKLYSIFIFALLLAFFINHFAFKANLVVVTSAFVQNFLMSALFISMLILRGNSRGQNIYIALTKMLGTLLVAIQFHFIQKSSLNNHLLHFLYVSVFLMDLLYIVLLYQQLKKERINPWFKI